MSYICPSSATTQPPHPNLSSHLHTPARSQPLNPFTHDPNSQPAAYFGTYPPLLRPLPHLSNPNHPPTPDSAHSPAYSIHSGVGNLSPFQTPQRPQSLHISSTQLSSLGWGMFVWNELRCFLHQRLSILCHSWHAVWDERAWRDLLSRVVRFTSKSQWVPLGEGALRLGGKS